MLLLALDSATPRVTVALLDVAADGTSTVVAEHDDAGNRHGELLAPAITRVLDTAGARPADLAAVAAGVGPGPFTGLRVGVVTASSLADALAIPAYAVCSLDAIALRHRGHGSLLVATDARRKQVYWARYDATGARIDGPDIAVPQAGGGDRVVGTGAVMWRDVFGAAVDDTDPYPAAAAIGELAAARVAASAAAETLVPLYLRRPDAQPPGRPKSVLPA